MTSEQIEAVYDYTLEAITELTSLFSLNIEIVAVFAMVMIGWGFISLMVRRLTMSRL